MDYRKTLIGCIKNLNPSINSRNESTNRGTDDRSFKLCIHCTNLQSGILNVQSDAIDI